MSSFGGFGGFGSNPSTTQSGGFGGFGSTQQQNPTSGSVFGSTSTGFGSNPQPSGSTLFGSTSTGFGSGGGFGASGGSAFGPNKTTFGTTTTSGGGLFGSNTSTTGGFGGFGGSSSTFGAGTGTGGSLFGQNKPAFGGTTGGSLFGGGGTTGGFGTSSTTPAFGGGLTSTPQNNGTGNVQFQPVEEKDPGATGNAKSQYQTITIQEPYKPWSFEELRLVDYAQGRKHGNASNQPGAFGAGSGFGGFGQSSSGATGFGTGSTGGGLFGQQSTSSPFGQQSGTAATGFGSSGSNLFGPKPQTTSLFGGTTTTSGQTGGGLFGTSGGGFGTGTSGGFGSGAGSTLFGSQTQQQSKPAFGGFGSGTTGGFGSSTSGGFGTNTTSSGGGLFGSTTTTASPFAPQQQSTGTTFGGFGQQSQQQQGQTGTGLFGSFGSTQQNQPQKPSLFGSTGSTTGTSLFGGGQQAQQSSGSNLFGSGSTSNLFNKPAASTNPFGSLTSGAGGAGLFGSTQQQQSGGGGLFSQPAQQSTSNLFGAKPATGSSIFGQPAPQQQPAGSTLFGGSQQQQPPQTGFGSSLFATSQMQQPQQQQQPSQLNASQIQFPYGAPSLFLDVQSPTQSPGPIATPLSTSQKAKKQAIIPAYRINPNASSRLITPQKRPPGYGFSYSTYGTPGSAFGSPIGMGNSLLGSSIGRSLGKSYSSSSLRNSYKAQDSLLLPGAFSGNTKTAGSMKKLNINRNLNTRRSLFESDVGEDYATHNGLRKQVSFDSGAKQVNGMSTNGAGLNASTGALVRASSPDNPASTPSSSRLNGRPEMEQTNGTTGKELAVISEDGSPPAAATKNSMTEKEKSRLTQKDQTPGAYWMRPQMSELQSMSKSQLSRVKDFTVGRVGVGEIRFGDVDLTQVPLDKLFGDIVVLDVRRATVYGENTSVPKPSVGVGLNVPSEIMLENSWPRASGGRLPVFEKAGDRFSKHIKRLKRVEGTEFVHYDDKTGCWTFKVPHYTTYELVYDDDDEDMSTTVLSEGAPLAPTPLKATARAAANKTQEKSAEDSIISPPASSPDDTFEFKKRKGKHVPGGFDDQGVDILEDDLLEDAENEALSPQSFLGDRFVGSSAAEEDDQAMAVLPLTEESAPAAESNMIGSFPTGAPTTKQDDSAFNRSTHSPSKPKSILKPRDIEGTPLRAARLDVDDWAEQLQRTVSPMKRDRQTLKDMQATLFTDVAGVPLAPAASARGTGFATSIDLMNSIFGKSTGKPIGRDIGIGMGLRSGKRLRTDEQTEDADMAFHQCAKPQFGANGVLVYLAPGGSPKAQDGLLTISKNTIIAEHQDVHFASWAIPDDLIPPTIPLQQETSRLLFDDKHVPYTSTLQVFKFQEFAGAVSPTSPARIYEQQVWSLAGVLFDDSENGSEDRLSALKVFWAKLCSKDAEKQLSQATTLEEKAFIHLISGNITAACEWLEERRMFHLATVASPLPANQGSQRLMREQIANWRTQTAFSEFPDAVRAMYEIFAGNVCFSEGMGDTVTENRIPDLRFSERFQLTWRQAFGLHLFWGIDSKQGIENAVASYEAALRDGKETKRPIPWYVEQGISTGWKDPHPEERQDVLWGLVKLHTANYPDNVQLSEVVAPENVTGNPINARLSFQLLHLIKSHQGSEHTSPLEDDITRAYAASLEPAAAEDHEGLKTAVWALTHLSDRNERVQSIKRLLELNATLLDPSGNPLALHAPPGSEIQYLVPRDWECAAKALYARAVEHDPVSEAHWLINAGQLVEAHHVVCTVIGPDAVIEEDHDQLREILKSLASDPHRKNQIPERVFERGGALYHSYLELLDLEALHAQHRTTKKNDIHAHVQSIAKVLAGLHKEGAIEKMEIKQRAAMQFMGNHLVETNIRLAALGVPLTKDVKWRVSRQLMAESFA